MVTKAKAKTAKAKCPRADIAPQLVVLSAFQKKFSSGKEGFFGQVQDPRTGQKYQIIGAVAITSKN
jgi:hypothetical protein